MCLVYPRGSSHIRLECQRLIARGSCTVSVTILSFLEVVLKIPTDSIPTLRSSLSHLPLFTSYQSSIPPSYRSASKPAEFSINGSALQDLGYVWNISGLATSSDTKFSVFTDPPWGGVQAAHGFAYTVGRDVSQFIYRFDEADDTDHSNCYV